MKPEQLFAAADALQREAKRMQSLTAAAEVLRDAGTLEARVLESERRLATLHSDIAGAEARLHLARDAAVKLDAEMVEERERSLKQAEANKAAAEAEAKRIHADAVAQAERILDGARAEAERIRSVNEQLKEAADAHLAELGEQVVAKEQKRAELDAELLDLNERLAQARAEAARIVQGVAQ